MSHDEEEDEEEEEEETRLLQRKIRELLLNQDNPEEERIHRKTDMILPRILDSEDSLIDDDDADPDDSDKYRNLVLEDEEDWIEPTILDERIAERLNPYNPKDERISALQTLLFSSPDAITSSTSSSLWTHLKEGLRTTAFDSDPEISSLSLRIHIRLLKYDYFSAKESYLNLIQALLNFYRDKTRPLPTLDALDNKRSSSSSSRRRRIYVSAIVQAVKVIIAFNKDWPNHWLRYPDTFVDQMTSSMMELLSIFDSSKRILFPVHFISVIDPQCRWLRIWLRSHFGRTTILRKIDSRFLRFIVDSALRGIDPSFTDWSTSTDNLLQRNKSIGVLVPYAVFHFTVYALSTMTSHKLGRQRLQDDGEVIGIFVHKALTFIATSPDIKFFSHITQCLCNLAGITTIAETYFKIGSVIRTLLRITQMKTGIPTDNVAAISKVLAALYSSQQFIPRDESVLDFVLTTLQTRIRRGRGGQRKLLTGVMELCITLLTSYSTALHPKAVSILRLLYDVCDSYRKIVEPCLIKAFQANPSNAHVISEKKWFMSRILTAEDRSTSVSRIPMTPTGLMLFYENGIFIREIKALSSSIHPEDEWPPVDLYKDEEVISALKRVLHCVVSYDSISILNVESAIRDSSLLDDELLELRVLIGISMLSLNHFLYLESRFDIRTRITDWISDGIIDEDFLRFRFFLAFTESIGCSLPSLLLEDGRTDDPQVLPTRPKMESREFMEALKSLTQTKNWNSEAKRYYQRVSAEYDFLLDGSELADFYNLFELDEIEENFIDNEDVEIEFVEEQIAFSFWKRSRMEFNDTWQNELSKLNRHFRNKGFDWLISVVFFLLKTGDYHYLKLVLKRLRKELKPSPLWGHCVEMILFEQVPAVHWNLFRHSVLPCILVESWIQDCFLTVLPWSEISHVVSLIPLLFGSHYRIYLCISLFRYFEKEIKTGPPPGLTPIEYFRTLRAKQFRIGNYLPFMNFLDEKYSAQIPHFWRNE